MAKRCCVSTCTCCELFMSVWRLRGRLLFQIKYRRRLRLRCGKKSRPTRARMLGNGQQAPLERAHPTRCTTLENQLLASPCVWGGTEIIVYKRLGGCKGFTYGNPATARANHAFCQANRPWLAFYRITPEADIGSLARRADRFSRLKLPVKANAKAHPAVF